MRVWASRLLAVILALAVSSPGAAGEVPPSAQRTLAEALEELRRQGLQLVYSDRVVSPELKVVHEPRATSLRGALTDLLRPHGLRAELDPFGWLVVKRAHAPTAVAADPLRMTVRERIVVTAEPLVDLPVQVFRKGRPVAGLERDDFEVSVSSRRVEIVGFQAIDVAQVGPGGGFDLRTPSAARRRFLLLFDLSVSDPANMAKARSEARETASTFHPTDLVGLATYSDSGGATPVLDFTSDRRELVAAIERLGRVGTQQSTDPLRLTFSEISEGRSQCRIDCSEPESHEMLQVSPDEVPAFDRADQSSHRHRLLAASAALTGLARSMRFLPGRKHVIFVTEGFDDATLLGLQGSDRGERERMLEMSRALETGEYWKVDPSVRYGDSWAVSSLVSMTAEFRKSGLTMHALDTRGLVSGEARRIAGNSGLFLMAQRTGGAVYTSFSDLHKAIARILAATSLSYVLSIREDGEYGQDEFRPVKVRLSGAQKGARVLHPAGYHPASPYMRQTDNEKRIVTAASLLSAEVGGDFESAVLALPLALAGDPESVPVVVEVDGPSFAPEGRPSDLLQAEIYAYAINREGEIHDYLAQAVKLDLARVGTSLRQSGMKVWGRLNLRAGDYVVRALVRNSSTGEMSLSQTQLRVPERGLLGELALASVFVEPVGDWLVVGATRGGALGEYPFALDGRQFLPSAQPEAPPGAAIRFYLIGADLSATGSSISAEIYRSNGVIAADGEPRIAKAQEIPDSGLEWAETLLHVPELAPGVYSLRIEVRDSATGRVRTASSALTIDG